MVGNGSIDTKRHASEPPEIDYDHKSDNTEYDGFCILLKTPRREDKVIKKMGGHQDSEIQCWQLVVM
jgi:hypothetical protein